jgi:hypothetical protein
MLVEPTNPETPGPSLPKQLAALVARELEPDEKIVWVGHPGKILPIPPGFWFRVLVFAVLSIIFGFVANELEGGMRTVLWILCALASSIAVGGLALPLLWRTGFVQRNVYYLLTDRRLMIATNPPLGKQQVKSFRPDELTELRCIERDKGVGDLVFRGEGGTETRLGDGLMMLESVRDVEQQIRTTLGLPKTT